MHFSTVLEIVYGLVCAGMVVVTGCLYGYLVHALWVSRRRAAPDDGRRWPPVAMIIPCKGLDPDLRENLRRHFHHDYPDYQIVFAVADAADPAVPVIRDVIAAEPGRAAALVIAPRLPDCVEKASNQVAALDAVGPDAEVIVCADSDGLPGGPSWLRSLVAGLDRAAVVSGFRWYIPPKPSAVGYLQSAWDATWCLLHALGKTVWGGAMAFTTATYRELDFRARLETAVTDDLALQVQTHRAGRQTGFAPGAMSVSEPADRFADFYRWAVRQAQLVRLVCPALWLMGFGTGTVYGLFYLLTPVLLLAPGPALGRSLPLAALAALTVSYLGRGYLTYRLARALLPHHAGKTGPLRWVYYWANPLADLLAPVVAYASLLSGTIRWRGVGYRVRRGRVVRV